jgi:hypothetical protein
MIAVGEIVGAASEGEAGMFVGVITGVAVGSILLSEVLGCIEINIAMDNAVIIPSRVRSIAALLFLFLFIADLLLFLADT